MIWNIEKHRIVHGQQELQVVILVRELTDTYAYDARSWIEHFKDMLKTVKRTNNFSADLMYGGKCIDEKTAEVWKMKVNGDYNYKMFTVTRE